LELREEAFELCLHRRLQQLPCALAQKVGQRVRNRVSTREFDDVIFFDGGAPSMVGGLCRNDNPTRCTASFQITQTPDSPIALERFDIIVCGGGE
jgi:hypothetical protein